MKLSVVIPAFNEEEVLASTLTEVSNYLRRVLPNDHEIIVVDDGSRDRTAQLAEATFGITLLRHASNQGKGAAVKTGALASRGDYILFMDADNSTKIGEIEPFLQALDQGYDIAIASRALANSEITIAQNVLKQALGKLGNLVIRTVATPGIRDTQCGFKLFKRATCLVLFQKQTIKRWAFDIELLALARWHHLKVKELPIHWSNNFNSKVKSHDYLTTLMAVFGVQWRRLRGKYNV